MLQFGARIVDAELPVDPVCSGLRSSAQAAVRLADGGHHPTAHDVGLGEASARAGESAAFPARRPKPVG